MPSYEYFEKDGHVYYGLEDAGFVASTITDVVQELNSLLKSDRNSHRKVFDLKEEVHRLNEEVHRMAKERNGF